jgi:hypothetical protein
MSILDLNGKVVFKVKLGNEIKKIVIHNDELTFNELCLMMQRIFSEKIGKSDEFTLKYTDEGMFSHLIRLFVLLNHLI